MKRFRFITGALAMLVAVALSGAASGVWAATPASGTLSAPASGQTSSVNWTGGPYTGATADPSLCTSVTCDTFQLTVNIPSDFYLNNPNDAVHVRIDWQDSTNDFDLYVYDASGNLVASSAQGGTTSEDADAGQLPAGTYTVKVVAFATVNASYSGSATLGPEPQNATGTARYKDGKQFAFSQPLQLTGPADLAFQASGVEPRAAYDQNGNIYVAAIQGVPAGTDVWKSTDGGQSFTYLGQPDGAQAAAILGARGAGAGGGDEDIAIGSTGNVYVNSLWLGSSTQSTSTDGGTTWTVNPVSSDVPIVDRQWIAARGEKELYLTYKQLGVLLANTPSIFVAKSFDGGLTFPQVTEVTTPAFGVQPGIQGNIAVDPANGNVYTVFVGSNANELYVARSTDGGKTFVIRRVYRGVAGANFANTFASLAIDQAGNLHVVFSDGRNVYLTNSTDAGDTWRLPVRVSNGAGTKTAIFPWISAGAAGKVDIVWLGTSAASNMDSTATWRVFFAQTQNDLANVPTFQEKAATDVMHTGPVCVNGTGCPDGTRNLADYFTDTVYRDGNAMFVYPSDQNTSAPQTFFVKQTAGPVVTGK